MDEESGARDVCFEIWRGSNKSLGLQLFNHFSWNKITFKLPIKKILYRKFPYFLLHELKFFFNIFFIIATNEKGEKRKHC
jgi:hypothetical protein